MTPTIKTLPPADVLETLNHAPASVTTTILDPWYNKGIGGYRDDYHSWLESVITAAARISQHIFVWGFPEIIAHQVARIPPRFKLTAWLTWYYKTALPSFADGVPPRTPASTCRWKTPKLTRSISSKAANWSAGNPAKCVSSPAPRQYWNPH